MKRARDLQRLVVFGANTDVGKTVIATGLVRAALRIFNEAAYCKPLQTGTGRGDSDINTILSYCTPDERDKLAYTELYSWPDPVSPHVAAANDPDAPSDEAVCKKIVDFFRSSEMNVGFIETAGGVMSPGVKGTPQAEMYQSSFPEAILVGDGKLGGISTTFCALESLVKRKYNVRGIIMIEEDSALGNSEYIRSQWCHSQVVSLPGLPPIAEPLFHWHDNNGSAFESFIRDL
mmetsp:Transcript_4818/g.5574  ORF Transcript_4818/g.5574 Transcript_4818/m.5574 type:complete len:233 (-) Transcript_4818:384-1082(-)